MSSDSTPTLRCSRCREHLPAEQFPPSTVAKGAGYCRSCNSRYQREWQSNRARVPRSCNGCGVTFERWDNYAHPGSAATHCHPCYLTKVRERMARRDKRAVGNARSAEPGSQKWVEAKRAELLAMPNPTCGLCGGAIDPADAHGVDGAPQLDHIVPVRAGGSHADHNVQLSHALCNRRANDKGYRIWRQHPMPRVDVMALAF